MNTPEQLRVVRWLIERGQPFGQEPTIYWRGAEAHAAPTLCRPPIEEDMNAKEAFQHFENRGANGAVDVIVYPADEFAKVIIDGLKLLAAAEANDGSTPETDAEALDGAKWDEHRVDRVVRADFARTLEQQRNGLAARVREFGMALAKIANMSAPRATSVQREINTAALDAFSAPIIDGGKT